MLAPRGTLGLITSAQFANINFIFCWVFYSHDGPGRKWRIARILIPTSFTPVPHPRLPVNHLETPCCNSTNCWYREILNTGLGGKGEEVCLQHWECNPLFPVSIKEMNHTKNWQKPYKRGILACPNGGQVRLRRLVKHNNSDTSRRTYQVCGLGQCYSPAITHFYLCGYIYYA